MRTLRFIVEGQIIKQDSNCDFDNLVPGTKGYLEAEFIFSEEWKDFIKVASFFSYGEECPAQILKNGKKCIIPSEALVGRRFSIGIIGKNKNNIKITTNKIEVVQNGG